MSLTLSILRPAVVAINPLDAIRFPRTIVALACAAQNSGWVTERSIVHAWKACVLKGTRGSNPRPSAIA